MAGCTTTTLSEFIPTPNTPWDRRRILHAYRRMNFGTYIGNVDEQMAKTPAQFIDEQIDAAATAPEYPQPEWWDWGYSDYMSRGLTERIFEDSVSLAFDWAREMIDGSFHARIKMFWLNHFVVKLDDVFCSASIWRYMNTLHTHSMGNFKTFAYEVGITPAMLAFLNGEQNNKFEPNENYARELFELFTLGRDVGYTQEDIVQAARALTGWQIEDCARTKFNATLFDSGMKVIFDKEEDFTYGTLMNHLFDSRSEQISKFICRKLYVEFISDDVDETIVDGLAATFLANDFELEPVYRQLFKSEHFFDDKNIGVKIKSPYQLTLGLLSEFDAPVSDELVQQLYWINSSIGQDLFNPPDVAGWKGNRTWVDSSTLAIRWTLVDNYSWYIYSENAEIYRTLAKVISNNSEDVEQVVQSIIEYFLPAGLQTDGAYNSAIAVFKGEVPSNYFEDGTWTLDFAQLPYQMILLMQHLGRLPEYQMY